MIKLARGDYVRASWNGPILVEIGSMGFSRLIHKMYTTVVFFICFYAVPELGYCPHRWTDFHPQYATRRVVRIRLFLFGFSIIKFEFSLALGYS